MRDAAPFHDDTFEGFVEDALPRLMRFAGWVAGPSGDPEGLVHGALARVGARWDSLRLRIGDPEVYVRRAIVDGRVPRWRSSRHEPLVEGFSDPAASHDGPGQQRSGRLWQAVGSLPRPQRAVVVLRFVEDMSVARTAHLLGVGEGTVTSRTSDALHSMRGAVPDLARAGDAADVTALARDAAASARMPVLRADAAEIMADHVVIRRRRARMTSAAAVTAVVAVLVAGVVGAATLLGDRGPRQESAPPASGQPSAYAAPSPVPAPPTDPVLLAEAVITDVAGYRFVREEEAGAAGSAALRDTAIDQPWPLDPCRPTAYPTDARREAMVGVTYPGPDGSGATLLARYPEAATASEALQGFARTLAACGRLDEPTPPPGSGLVQWTLGSAPALGDEALAVLASDYTESDGVRGSGQNLVIVRVGAMLLMVSETSATERLSPVDQRLAGITSVATAEVDHLRSSVGPR